MIFAVTVSLIGNIVKCVNLKKQMLMPLKLVVEIKHYFKIYRSQHFEQNLIAIFM